MSLQISLLKMDADIDDLVDMSHLTEAELLYSIQKRCACIRICGRRLVFRSAFVVVLQCGLLSVLPWYYLFVSVLSLLPWYYLFVS